MTRYSENGVRYSDGSLKIPILKYNRLGAKLVSHYIESPSTLPKEEGFNDIDPDNVKKLWHAVLQIAISDLRTPITYDKDGKEKNLTEKDKRDARHWFKSNRKEVNSFLGICESLSLNAIRMRRLLSDYINIE